MSEKSEKDILDSIRRSVEEIKAILILTNQGKLEETKTRLLKEGTVKYQIYDMCDGIKTTKDIANALQKDVPYVHSYLSILRREGLVRVTEKEGKQIYEQIF
jgi:hypothetical protein